MGDSPTLLTNLGPTHPLNGLFLILSRWCIRQDTMAMGEVRWTQFNQTGNGLGKQFSQQSYAPASRLNIGSECTAYFTVK